MTDLTKINVPFRELVKETQWALKGALGDGETIQFKDDLEDNWSQSDAGGLLWIDTFTYRLKPKPVVEEVVHRMGLKSGDISYPNPLLSTIYKDDPNWTPVNITMTWTDGVVTGISAELVE